MYSYMCCLLYTSSSFSLQSTPKISSATFKLCKHCLQFKHGKWCICLTSRYSFVQDVLQDNHGQMLIWKWPQPQPQPQLPGFSHTDFSDVCKYFPFSILLVLLLLFYTFHEFGLIQVSCQFASKASLPDGLQCPLSQASFPQPLHGPGSTGAESFAERP